AKEEGRRLLVIPDVSAGSQAGTFGVVTPLPAEQVAIRRLEARLGAEGAHVVEGGFLYDVRQIAAYERVHEPEGLIFQRRQIGRDVDRGVPGVGEARGVQVADRLVGVAVDAPGRRDAPGAPVGEVPGPE